MRFDPKYLGHLEVSPKAQEVIDQSTMPLGELLEKHTKGQWGQISETERSMNQSSIVDGEGTVMSFHDLEYEMILIRTRLSPFKNERHTEVVTGFEFN